MRSITKSMEIPELSLKPPITGSLQLSDDIQQTLALLTAYADGKRRILKSSASGVLSVASPRIADIVHYTGVGASDDQTGKDVPCSECLVMAHPDNTGLIWVRGDKAALATNAWPLSAKESIGFTIDNLKQLNMLIVVAGEKVIVAYSR